MKKIQKNPALLVITFSLAFLLFSCDFLFDLGRAVKNEVLGSLGEGEFYAQNMTNNQYYKLKASVLAEGKKCVIWAETNSGISITKAEEIAARYDEVIRPRIVDSFGKKNFYDSRAEQHFNDILDYANWFANGDNGDGKLTILLLDIKDGFKDPNKDSYVAGYFFSGNFFEQGQIPGSRHYSNGRDMIYIDTYPGLNNLEKSYGTFAHELQHLISWITSVQTGKQKHLDTWIDEGLSSQAEHIYLNNYPLDKCDWFRDDPNKTMAQGNNFFAWDNRRESRLAILDDYATVYMFFRWLYLQSGKNESIFFDIGNLSGFDHNMIVNYAKDNINSQWDTWEKLLQAWMIGNYIPDDTTYGYKGDTTLQGYAGARPKLSTPTRTVMLFPGEGVYSTIQNPFTPTNIANTGKNIKYTGIRRGSISNNMPYTGDVLLTFNANTDNTDSREIGSLTGVAASVSRNIDAAVPEFSGAYILDARDVLGREQEKELDDLYNDYFFSGR